MKNGLTKLYDKFTPNERFKLLMAAIARGDDSEADRLGQYCPRKTYRMPVAGFVERNYIGMLLASSFAAEWNGMLRVITLIEKSIETYKLSLENYITAYVEGAKNAWWLAGREDPLPSLFKTASAPKKGMGVNEQGEIVVEVPEQYSLLLTCKKWELKSYLTAFESFCAEIDVPLEHFLAWVPAVIESVNEWKEKLADVEPVDELVEQCLPAFRSFWAKAETQ